ncbi:30S ribosomal protein S8 [archaeon]|jgi:small subunit ribosomal protein S8|nr:30S ribosomal protein S8 [archaeon]MBT6697681.1 30S ribosomal protein S8 [archaeon]
MLNDPLAAALTKIHNAEKVGKREVVIAHVSNMIRTVLTLMNEHGYVGTFQENENGAGKVTLKINLLGNVNKCNVIKPRFSTGAHDFTKWEKRYLPARDFGMIVVSTSQGVMTHYSAKEKKIGGKLLAYCY